jgi:hypothetical protein
VHMRTPPPPYPLPDVPFQPTDLSSRRHRHITSPPAVATRTRTARRL